MGKKKSKKATIERENWNGSYRIVARRSDGRIATYKKDDRKEKISTLKRRFSSNRSFDKDVRVQAFSKVKFVTTKKGLDSRPKADFQYYVKASFDGKSYVGLSYRLKKGANKEFARNQAYDNLYRNIHGDTGRPISSNAEEGERIFNRRNGRIIEEGIREYRAVGKA